MSRSKTSTRKTTKNAVREKTPPTQPRSPRESLSLDKKLDITGVVLIMVGILLVLGMYIVPKNHDTQQAGIFFRLFGWGLYILPFACTLIGIWLIIRNFERIPSLTFERALGIGLSFLNLLIFFHLILLPESPQTARELADTGKGGGLVGYVFYTFLVRGLGIPGLLVIIIALSIICVALILDKTVLDLFSWVLGVIKKIAYFIQEKLPQSAQQESAPPVEVSRSISVNRPRPQVQQQTTSTILEPVQAQPQESGPQVLPDNMGEDSGKEELVWTLPQVAEILDEGTEIVGDDDRDQQRARLIEETLASFGAPAHVVEINRGPTITQFGVEPDFIEKTSGKVRVRVNKITALADDLALVLAASRVRIQAPVPGKGFVGIEVPNENVSLVALRDVVESKGFHKLRSPLRFALGQDVAGNAVSADLMGMPHMLIAGATGTGKSVCVNSIIACLLLHNTPHTLRLIMVDPKRVELTGYNGIPHLLAPVVVEVERIVAVLQWVTREMDSRYQKFSDLGARNIGDYNTRMRDIGDKSLPYMVVIIDELADLMMVAPDQTEKLIIRLAQLARATGIHLLISTQRPSADVVTGLIKANIPARIAFATASGIDSRVILDTPGAERLLGRGDMLFQPPDAPAPIRLQGVFVSDEEIMRLVKYWRQYGAYTIGETLHDRTAPDAKLSPFPLKQMPIWEEVEEQIEDEDRDNVYDEAVAVVRRQGRASISMLQRRMRIGYTRAARIIDQMENNGIIGPPKGGSYTRDVLDYGEGASPADDL
ncbi:MAG: DNA translocase FtsK 4TM domain-containing protein [Anaerolineales bacterium]|nr:DNA translocase FtsK 4TM domain-containing protein [Anaerolineales bacterium]